MSRLPRPLLMLVLAAALTVRLLVPAGWMPASDGGFAIELCPAAGPVATPAPMHGMAGAHHPDGPAHQDAGQCDFASLHAAAAPPLALALLAPPPVLAPAPALAARPELAPIRAAAPPLPARGPPALA